MPPVSAVPIELLDLPSRTADTHRALWRRAAALGGELVGAGPPAVAHAALGAAVLAHAGRADDLADRAAATGLALLLAGGAPGAVAVALRSDGGQVDPAAAVALLAAALGLDPAAGAAVGRPDVDPVAVAALAAAVGPALAVVARTHPHLVGPVDGMPVDLRYEANRRIAAAAGGAYAPLAAAGRQLLYVDPARGHAAEVLGDLRAAPNVAVVVPGMANRVDRFSTVLDKALALRAAAAALDPPEDLATIAWLGYDSPLVDAVVDDEARTGGPHLARLVDGVVAGGAAGDATLTVVGHSYGSVVAGEALRAGLDVDAVAVTGSPGVGAARAGDLGDVPVYALSAPLDVVSLTERYGTDPADPDFGATVLATGVAGHWSYFEPGSVAVTNLALVATGRAGEAARAGPTPWDVAVDTIQDVHDAVVESRVDAVQRGVAGGAGVVSTAVDAAEARLPAPVASVVDGAQDVAGAGLELADATVDLVQQVTSPDVVLSLGGDLWEVVSG